MVGPLSPEIESHPLPLSGHGKQLRFDQKKLQWEGSITKQMKEEVSLHKAPYRYTQ